MKQSKAQYKQLVSNKTTHAPYTVFSTYTVHQFNNIEHVPLNTYQTQQQLCTKPTIGWRSQQQNTINDHVPSLTGPDFYEKQVMEMRL